mmetsp:Transcript_102177/g.161237  ORF Transcript_102177/g.161237 Transcript_102177/m.161237 type:complete len:230 (+) Transcript_102177:2975-3664(+)
MVDAKSCTVPSTAEMRSVEDCICIFRRRSDVSFFSSVVFLETTSIRVCNAFNSDRQLCEGLSASRLASTIFSFTYDLASAKAFCVAVAATSHNSTASTASLATTSMPFKNGNSASCAFCSASSALVTRLVASAAYSDANTCSLCSLDALSTKFSFLSAAVNRFCIPFSSSFRKPCAVLSFTSTSFNVAPSFVCVDLLCFSRCSTVSIDGNWSSVGADIVATLSTSCSAS